MKDNAKTSMWILENFPQTSVNVPVIRQYDYMVSALIFIDI